MSVKLNTWSRGDVSGALDDIYILTVNGDNMSKLIETSIVHSNFRVTIRKVVRSIMNLEMGNIVGFYETPEGILIKKLG